MKKVLLTNQSKQVSISLELGQYKNVLVSVKIMFVLNLPPFFPHLHGKGKRAAILKLACVSQKRNRSYIVLALVPHNYLAIVCNIFYEHLHRQCII